MEKGKLEGVRNRCVFYENERKVFDDFIIPLLKKGENVSVFSSMTYLTPNYLVLELLRNLSDFAKAGFDVHLLVWDLDMLTHEYYKRVDMGKYPDLSIHNYIEDKIEEVLAIFLSFGTDRSKLHIYKASAVFHAMVGFKEPDLFLSFYRVLNNLKTDDVTKNYSGYRRKIKSIFQAVLDVFFACFLHRLYPEELHGQIDIAFTGENKREIYNMVREAMFEEGIIKTKKPLIVVESSLPYINNGNLIPEWNMSLDELIRLIGDVGIDRKEAKVLFENVFKDVCRGFVLVDKAGFQEDIDYKQALACIDKMPLGELPTFVAYTFHGYFQELKKDYKPLVVLEPDFWDVDSGQEFKDFSRVTRRPVLLNMLLLADGTRTVTEMAKELGLHLSNASTYLSMLKKEELVTITDEKTIKRTIKGIKLDFDSIQ